MKQPRNRRVLTNPFPLVDSVRIGTFRKISLDSSESAEDPGGNRRSSLPSPPPAIEVADPKSERDKGKSLDPQQKTSPRDDRGKHRHTPWGKVKHIIRHGKDTCRKKSGRNENCGAEFQGGISLEISLASDVEDVDLEECEGMGNTSPRVGKKPKPKLTVSIPEIEASKAGIRMIHSTSAGMLLDLREDLHDKHSERKISEPDYLKLENSGNERPHVSAIVMMEGRIENRDGDDRGLSCV